MRFLGYTVGDDTPTPPPTPELMAEMGQFIEEETAGGHIVAAGAFHPIAGGTLKISLHDGEFTVTDGPFTEAKELIGGWALTEYDTIEECIASTKKFLSIAGGGDTTVRRIFTDEDFPPGFEDAQAANASQPSA